MSGGYPPHNQGYPPYAPSAPPHNPTYPTPSAPYDSSPSKPPKDNKPYAASPPTAQPYVAGPQPYGGGPQPYGASPPTAQPYGGGPQSYGASPPTAQPYGGVPQSYGASAPSAQPYGGGPQSYAASAPSAQPYGGGPQSYGGGPTNPYGGGAQSYGAPANPYGGGPQGYGGGPQGYGAPGQPYGGGTQPWAPQPYGGFAPGTDPSIMACFQLADQDRSGMIDDYELQRALSSYNQDFSMRTVHLLMYNFTNSSVRKIGPKEFTALYYSLQNWRSIFERFDRDQSGKIDVGELRDALLSLGLSVSPAVLDLLVSKFDKTGGKSRAIEYDNFIECCLTVKGLTEKFKEKDTAFSGSATFAYESFMLTVLPFLIA